MPASPKIHAEQSPRPADAGPTNGHASPPRPQRAVRRAPEPTLPWPPGEGLSFKRGMIGAAYLVIDEGGLADLIGELTDQILDPIKARPLDVSFDRLDPQRLAPTAEQLLLDLPSYQAGPLDWLRQLHTPNHDAQRRELDALLRDWVSRELNLVARQIRAALRSNPFVAAPLVERLKAEAASFRYPPADPAAWPQAQHEQRLLDQVLRSGPLPALHTPAIARLLEEGRRLSLDAAARAAARAALEQVERRALVKLFEHLAQQLAECRDVAERLDTWSALARTEQFCGSLPGQIREPLLGPNASQLRTELLAAWQVERPGDLAREAQRRLEQRLQQALLPRHPDLPPAAQLCDLAARGADGSQLHEALVALIREGTSGLASPWTAVRNAGVERAAEIVCQQSTPFNSIAGYEFAALGIDPATVEVLEHPPARDLTDQGTLDGLAAAIERRLQRTVNRRPGEQLGLVRIVTKFPVVVTSGYTALAEGFGRAVEAGHLPTLDDLLAEARDGNLAARCQRLLAALADLE